MTNYACIVMIENHSKKDVLFFPGDERFPNLMKLIKSKTFLVFEPHRLGFLIDLDKAYFQFVNMKRKIKPNNISKYGIKLDFLNKEKNLKI